MSDDRSREQAAILAHLARYWALHRELRLGQIVANARRDRAPVPAVYYLLDADVLAALEAELCACCGNADVCTPPRCRSCDIDCYLNGPDPVLHPVKCFGGDNG